MCGTINNKQAVHNNTRHHTSDNAFKLMSLPKMAVKPQINTQKCKYR